MGEYRGGHETSSEAGGHRDSHVRDTAAKSNQMPAVTLDAFRIRTAVQGHDEEENAAYPKHESACLPRFQCGKKAESIYCTRAVVLHHSVRRAAALEHEKVALPLDDNWATLPASKQQ